MSTSYYFNITVNFLPNLSFTTIPHPMREKKKKKKKENKTLAFPLPGNNRAVFPLLCWSSVRENQLKLKL